MKIGINIHPTAMSKRRVLRSCSFNYAWDLCTSCHFWHMSRFRFIGFRIVVRGKKP